MQALLHTNTCTIAAPQGLETCTGVTIYSDHVMTILMCTYIYICVIGRLCVSSTVRLGFCCHSRERRKENNKRKISTDNNLQQPQRLRQVYTYSQPQQLRKMYKHKSARDD